jgi:hypothetical protein
LSKSRRPGLIERRDWPTLRQDQCASLGHSYREEA